MPSPIKNPSLLKYCQRLSPALEKIFEAEVNTIDEPREWASKRFDDAFEILIEQDEWTPAEALTLSTMFLTISIISAEAERASTEDDESDNDENIHEDDLESDEL